MKKIIKNREIVEDAWVTVADGDAVPAAGDVIVSLPRLGQEAEALGSREGRLGVRLAPDDDPEAVAPHLSRVALVAVDFPTWADGRGYSTARLLRERYGYSGELRAMGNVLRDQIFYMARVGFDAFEVTEGRPLESALEGLQDFSVTYQPDANEKLPLYRRR